MHEFQRQPLVNEFYQQYLVDQDPAGFAARIAQHYQASTLERLLEHPARMTRRSATLAIGFLGDFRSNAALGRALSDPDRAVRTMAENGIRALWRRDGSHAEQQALDQVIRHNVAKRFEQAVVRASDLLRQAPWLAEAWNQRAVGYFELGRYELSIHDCQETLERNPYHFAAAASMGQGYLKLKRPADALEAFLQALRLNPALEQIRAHADYLQRTLKNSE